MIHLLMFAAAAVHCHPVEGDRIRGADLAAGAAVFSALPADLTIGFAPQPGSRRLFEKFELARIAKVNGLEDIGEMEPMCFERAVAPLDAAAVQAAMRRALDAPDAQIEIVELSKFPAPAGEMVFSRAALTEPPSNTPATWSGAVIYDGGRFPIWARVRIAVHRKRVIATTLLRPGHEIAASDVQLQDSDEFPHSTAPLASLEQAIGKIPRRLISAGAPLMALALDEPNEVEAGQSVVVEVRSGTATVTVEAKAESAGRRGEMLSFRNPASGKVFRARVEDKGRALIDCQPLEMGQ
jgi:flagella basal body P-ring formation protein FlgA